MDDLVSFFHPLFAQNGKESIRLGHVLAHTSGLVAHRHFYKEGLGGEEVLEQICKEKMTYTLNKEVLYSELNSMILYNLVEEKLWNILNPL